MDDLTERASLLGMRLLGMGERDGAATVVECKAEIERLREILRTIVARADDAKALCNDGHPVSAYNLASGILGQIGSDAVALRKERQGE